MTSPDPLIGSKVKAQFAGRQWGKRWWLGQVVRAVDRKRFDVEFDSGLGDGTTCLITFSRKKVLQCQVADDDSLIEAPQPTAADKVVKLEVPDEVVADQQQAKPSTVTPISAAEADQPWESPNFPDALRTPPRSEVQVVHKSKLNPQFLHSNSTSHSWPFGAIAEHLDNAKDEGSKEVYIWAEMCLGIDYKTGATTNQRHLFIQNKSVIFGKNKDAATTLDSMVGFGVSDKKSWHIG